MRSRTFTLPGRHSAGVEAITQACHNTADDKLRQLVGGSLQNRSNNHDTGAQEDRFATAKRISNKYTCDRACLSSVSRGQYCRLDLPQKHPRLYEATAIP